MKFIVTLLQAFLIFCESNEKHMRASYHIAAGLAPIFVPYASLHELNLHKYVQRSTYWPNS